MKIKKDNKESVEFSIKKLKYKPEYTKKLAEMDCQIPS